MRRFLLIIVIIFSCSINNVNNGQVVATTGFTLKLLDYVGLKDKLGVFGKKIFGIASTSRDNDVEDYKRLYKFISNSLCSLRENEYLMSIYGNNNDCLFNINKEMVLMKYDMAAKGIDVAMVGLNKIGSVLGIGKSSSEKVSIKELNAQFEAAIKDLNELNRQLNYDISSAIFRGVEKNNVKSGHEVSKNMKGI